MTEHDRSLTVARLKRLPVHQTDEAWEVGVLTLPAMVQEEDDPAPWRPVFAACASTAGGASMTPMVRAPDLPSSSALDALANFALESHLPGAAPLDYLPARVRVSSMPSVVHDHFVAAMEALEIVVEIRDELPNLQNLADCIAERMESSGPIDAPSIMKPKGMTIDRVRAFAEAAAVFWDARPWTHFPTDAAWVIEPRPRTRVLRACVVMGAGEEEFGLAFLPSATDLYTMALSSMVEEGPTRPPGTVWSMTFSPSDEAPPHDQDLWIAERLPLADPDAFPVPMGLTQADNVRRPTPEQLTLMEALLRGLATIDADTADSELMAFDVSTFDGPTSLRLRCGARL